MSSWKIPNLIYDVVVAPSSSIWLILFYFMLIIPSSNENTILFIFYIYRLKTFITFTSASTMLYMLSCISLLVIFFPYPHMLVYYLLMSNLFGDMDMRYIFFDTPYILCVILMYNSCVRHPCIFNLILLSFYSPPSIISCNYF